MVRLRLVLKGVVQGVGFRPLVYRLARRLDLKGYVLNSEEGLVIEVEGEEERLEEFIRSIRNSPPPLSRIDEVRIERLEPKRYGEFLILESTQGERREVVVPKDVAMCEECRREILDPADRHYLYPFTNCTNCGPRFTIITDLPYDRKNTTMSVFPMCEACRKEYEDPLNRRFHAQPTACPNCGPRIFVADREGRILAGDWLRLTWTLLLEGKIGAIKGIGGFHIACDATNGKTVSLLRQRKGRDAKPFALMMRDLNTVRRYCVVSEKEESLLLSREAPIVILRRKGGSLPRSIAPNLDTLGVMLPYTPLHFLLLSGPLDVLVMTSGNYTDLPIVKDDGEAFERLYGICDFFVIHERAIENRCDDSVLQVIGDEVQLIRRSRGFAPEPIKVKRRTTKNILGMGGEMKNNFCILRKEEAYLSQYIGEIDSFEAEEYLKAAIETLKRMLKTPIDVVAFDAHPGYSSSSIAKELPAEVHLPVYHHHAHMTSVLAENGLEQAIGVILDGTGYGPDGHLWGFEFLLGGYTHFERLFHLAYVPLPGAEWAIKEPWRVATSYLLTYLGEEGAAFAVDLFGEERVELVRKMLEMGFNSPLSSGCGRLFDAVAALLNVCLKNTYEGQAACELSELAERGTCEDFYGYEIEADAILPHVILRGVLKDIRSGLPRELISLRFHNSIAQLILDLATRIRRERGLDVVVLSGGSFQNRYLLRKTKQLLKSGGFSVFSNRLVPPNDGGISLGQALIADRKICA